MAFFDRLFVGKILKDFGSISVRQRGIAREKISVLLSQRGGERYLVFKSSTFAWLGAGVQYVELPVRVIPQLERWLQEIQSGRCAGEDLPR